MPRRVALPPSCAAWTGCNRRGLARGACLQSGGFPGVLRSTVPERSANKLRQARLQEGASWSAGASQAGVLTWAPYRPDPGARARLVRAPCKPPARDPYVQCQRVS
jgi:hypothetical protein